MAKMEDGFGKPEEVRVFVEANAECGNPASVLAALDRYAEDYFFLMNVGPEKGPLLTAEVEKVGPAARIIELGSYCGYSAVLIAQRLGPDGHLVCVELDPEAVRGTSAIIEFAGLADRAEVIEGASGDIIPTLDGTFDLIFLDHWKDLYEEDLKAFEAHGLLHKGSIIFADNVGPSFNPESYLDYVRTSGKYDSTHHLSTIEYTDRPDAAEVSVYRG